MGTLEQRGRCMPIAALFLYILDDRLLMCYHGNSNAVRQHSATGFLNRALSRLPPDEALVPFVSVLPKYTDV